MPKLMFKFEGKWMEMMMMLVNGVFHLGANAAQHTGNTSVIP